MCCPVFSAWNATYACCLLLTVRNSYSQFQKAGAHGFSRRFCVRSNFSPFPASSKDNSYTSFSIGKCLVRVQLKPEIPANVGKTGGAYIPQPLGELHRADEANIRATNLRRLATRFENPTVKSSVMGCDKLRAKEQTMDSRP